MNSFNKTFDPQTLADDLFEVCRIYSQLFAGLDSAYWDKPTSRSPNEWNLHETVAHLCALNGDGLQCIKNTLRGEPYTFVGLNDRYQFNAFNRKGIDDHLDIPMKQLCDELLGILDEAACIARDLQPDQAKLTAQMPIYNRPVRIDETLAIINFHAGLVHSAQVAEPAGLPPLWVQLSAENRHRVIGRAMCALSLLYRYDLGGHLKAIVAFRVDGPGAGNWHLDVSPGTSTSDEGVVDHASLTIHLRETSVFCRMFTGRFSLPVALLTGQLKLRGDLRLFLRMGTLFHE